MVKSKFWTLKNPFDGKPQPSNFEIIEEDLPDTLKDGEILTEAIHWTVDPYMRTSEVGKVERGQCMPGGQVAKVLASKNSTHPVGSTVVTYSGWRTHSIIPADATHQTVQVPDMGGLPSSLSLGILGMPGMTAYFGFLEICQPKEGETVLVNGAAGAVGSLVGQIAKIKGCKVIGCAGTDDKCQWLRELGFDEVFNYKKVDLAEALKKAAPDGYDCFFDNIGNDFTSTALRQMKLFGRISICGSISSYNAKEQPSGPYPFGLMLMKQLSMEGFIVLRWAKRWQEGQMAMGQWIKEGKLKYRETITKGFENMPSAFMGLFEGANTGKAIITA